MKDGISKNEDMLELERRRLAEQVTESVEKNLTKRYTWLAIIVSFLIGGGVATIVDKLTENAQKKLLKTELVLEQVDSLLKKGKKSVEDLNNLSNDLNEQTTKVNEDLEILKQARESYVRNLTESLQGIEQLELRVNDLVKAVNTLAKNKDIKRIEEIVPDKKINVQSTLKRATLSNYTIYLHYSQNNEKSIVEDLRKYLHNMGYVMPPIRKVDYNVRDIRYYHDENHEEAVNIKNNVIEFLSQKNIDMDLKTTYFGKQYPDVRKGNIEVWLYF